MQFPIIRVQKVLSQYKGKQYVQQLSKYQKIHQIVLVANVRGHSDLRTPPPPQQDVELYLVCSNCSWTPARMWSWTWSVVTIVRPPHPRMWSCTWSAVTVVGPPPPQDMKMNLVCSDCSRTPLPLHIFDFQFLNRRISFCRNYSGYQNRFKRYIQDTITKYCTIIGPTSNGLSSCN